MWASIHSIHHPVDIRLDSRCSTSKNYKHIIISSETEINLVFDLISVFWKNCFSTLFDFCNQAIHSTLLYSPYTAWSSRRTSVCSMLSVCGVHTHTPSQFRAALLYLLSLSINPNTHYAEPEELCYQHPLRLHSSWEELAVPQMHQLSQDTRVTCLQMEQFIK